MKKFNLVLLVLVAALFGSSLVACSNGYSGDPETPEESYVTAEYSGLGITFIPVSGCSTITSNDNGAYAINGYEVMLPELLDFDYVSDSVSVKNRIRTNSLYHDGDYILVSYVGNVSPNELYRLEINNEDVALTAVTAPESAR